MGCLVIPHLQREDGGEERTFLERGEEDQLADEAGLDERSVRGDDGDEGGEDEEVVTQLAVGEAVSSRQLFEERVAQLAEDGQRRRNDAFYLRIHNCNVIFIYLKYIYMNVMHR